MVRRGRKAEEKAREKEGQKDGMQKMNIKLIASDLDGTLLTDNKGLSSFNRKMLEAAMEKGIYFVPATGRTYRSVPENIRRMKGVEYIITSNGAAIYSVSQQKRIYECLMTGEAVDAILKISRKKEVVMEAYRKGIPYADALYVADPKAYGASDYGAKYVKNTRTPIDNMEAFISEHREELDSMAFVCAREDLRNSLWMELERTVPQIYVTSSVPHLVEIGHQDAGKGKTLQHLLKMLDIEKEEAAAFGDADNDIDMLKAVKYGMAMANGSAACKTAASGITETNEEDGVGKAILRWLRGV